MPSFFSRSNWLTRSTALQKRTRFPLWMAATPGAVAIWVLQPLTEELAGATHEDQVAGAVHEGGAGQLLNLGLRQGSFGPVNAGQITVHRKAGGLELVAQAAHLPVGEFGSDQPVEPGFRLHGLARTFRQPFAPSRRHAIEMQGFQLGKLVNGHIAPRANGHIAGNRPSARWQA